MTAFLVVAALVAFLAGAYYGRGYWAWVIAVALLLGAGWRAEWLSGMQVIVLVALFGLLAVVFGQIGMRQQVVSRSLIGLMAKILPKMSETERAALEAGSVTWEGDLFSGRPDWNKLLATKTRLLSAAEQHFLDGPVEELCALADDWEITQRGDLDEATWEFLRRQGFLGLIIPEAYGGLGFSARAHGEIIAKLSSRSVTVAVSVMVPNSLGPAELLLHYGTEVQKNYHLPRLAAGDEIPCFALTGPENGSDAAAMEAVGVVTKGTYQGEPVTGIRLDWDKRYTTLGPKATLIGLAFRLRDPDKLIGETEDLGITLALVPADTAGVEIGDRHDPLGVPFLNGPNRGRGVFVPLDAIIGGPRMAGQGWTMLMDCLSAGRSISLPSLAAGCTQLTTRVVGAYATLRRQFGLPIGRFEGVQEKLARIGGLTYVVEAARRFTGDAVDAGEKPSVASAIVKAYTTEAMRVVVNDGMDVLAGAAISRGPRNVLARAYQAIPIGITVEGANILTRTLIVFGQGAVRCHPFVQKEMAAAGSRQLKDFDAAFFGHINHATQCFARAFVKVFTGGGLASVEAKPGIRRLFGRMGRLSTDFAAISEGAMASMGGGLKRREMISGRLADALAWMYLGSATLKRFLDEGSPEKDRPFMRWGVEHALHQTEEALRGVLDNLPNRIVAWKLRALTMPFGAGNRPPRDKLVRACAEGLMDGREARRRLSASTYTPSDDDPGLGRLEAALRLVAKTLPLEDAVKRAVKQGELASEPRVSLYQRAVDAGVITADQRRLVRESFGAMRDAVQVDAFDDETYRGLRG